MGIKCLLKFINEQSDLIQNVDNSKYKFKRIAIDISILIYRIIISVRNSGADYTNQQGEITTHILGLFNKTIELLNCNIIPVYIFDGKPPELKNKTLENRKQIKKKALEKLYLTDIAIDFSGIYSTALGAVFRVGFLGLLHADVVRERLER